MGAHGDHGVLGEGSWVPKGPKRAQGQPLDPWVLRFCSKASGRGCSHSLGRWACWLSAKSCCCCVCCVCCLRGWRGWRWWRCYCLFGCGACRFVWLILFLSVWYRLLASAGDALPLFCTLGGLWWRRLASIMYIRGLCWSSASHSHPPFGRFTGSQVSMMGDMRGTPWDVFFGRSADRARQ